MSITQNIVGHNIHALVSMCAMGEASASLSPRCRSEPARSLSPSRVATIIFICAHNKARYYTTCTHAWLPARRWRERASEQVSCNRQRGMAALRRWAQPTSLGAATTQGEEFEILEAEQTKIEHMWSCIFQNCFNMIRMKLRSKTNASGTEQNR